MGIYDLPAFINGVKSETGAEKVSYVGVSQGSLIMFYALAKLEKSFLADSLFTFAALDPCTVAISEGDDMYRNGPLHF